MNSGAHDYIEDDFIILELVYYFTVIRVKEVYICIFVHVILTDKRNS